jgi:hypothetical protein
MTMRGQIRRPNWECVRTTALGRRRFHIISSTGFQREIGRWVHEACSDGQIVQVELNGRAGVTMLKTSDFERLLAMAAGNEASNGD